MPQDSSVDAPPPAAAATAARPTAGAAAGGDTALDVSEEDDDDKEVDVEKRLQPLMPKSAVLRLLAELVRAYSGCAYLITQHVFTANQSQLVTEVRVVQLPDVSQCLHQVDQVARTVMNERRLSAICLSRVHVYSYQIVEFVALLSVMYECIIIACCQILSYRSKQHFS